MGSPTVVIGTKRVKDSLTEIEIIVPAKLQLSTLNLILTISMT